MGTIIHLNPPHRAAAPSVARDTQTDCQIVIFPGVRIERPAMPYGDKAAAEPAGGTRQGHRPRKSS